MISNFFLSVVQEQNQKYSLRNVNKQRHRGTYDVHTLFCGSVIRGLNWCGCILNFADFPLLSEYKFRSQWHGQYSLEILNLQIKIMIIIFVIWAYLICVTQNVDHYTCSFRLRKLFYDMIVEKNVMVSVKIEQLDLPKLIISTVIHIHQIIG